MAKGLVYEYSYINSDGNSDKIKFVNNALIYIRYKDFTGRELQKDISNKMFTAKNIELSEVYNKYKHKIDFDKPDWYLDLEQDELNELLPLLANNDFDDEFIRDFLIAMVSAGEYPIRRGYEEIMFSLPANIFADKELASILSNWLVEFMPKAEKKTVYRK